MLKNTRKGCKDVWNAFMVKGATFYKDIPYCPTTGSIPNLIINWEEAIQIYRKQLALKHNDFKSDSYITFNVDDYKFDKGRYDIWAYPSRSIKIIKHFAGIITPDFSTYIDMPEPIKNYNTYRMRAFGYFATTCGINVINNVRWDSSNNYKYCFLGIPKNSIVLVGTVASNLKIKENYKIFEVGFFKMLEVLTPKVILTYGSSNYSCFRKAKEMGIQIIQYESRTSKSFKGGNKHGKNA